MMWDNWEEGAIKADEEMLKIIETEFQIQFRYGENAYFEKKMPQIQKSLLKYFWR